MFRFRGQFEHTIDAKGRTSLPARFRDELHNNGESRLVITMSWHARTLSAYPLREWEAFEDRVNALPSFDKAALELRRRYISPAVDCDIDKLGRLLLPANLREYANLTRDVVWAGMGKTIELWDAAAHLAMRETELSDEEKALAAEHLRGV